MTAINFPDSPSDGDTHVVGGVTYTYNNAETKWKTTINSNAFLPLTGGTVSGNILMGGEIQHDGDTDTNISFDTDTILFDTAGSERFRVGSAGQLGIGGATYGTSGQVLTSGGASAAPSWESAGKILQVVQTFKNDTDSSSSTSLVDISGMSRSITPVAAGSSFLVVSDLSLSSNSTASTMWVNLWRDSTEIAQPSAGSAPATLSHYVQGAISSWNRSFTFLDTPTYTLGDSLTYKWRWQSDNASMTTYINRHSGNSDYTSVSQITVMEVAA